VGHVQGAACSAAAALCLLCARGCTPDAPTRFRARRVLTTPRRCQRSRRCASGAAATPAAGLSDCNVRDTPTFSRRRACRRRTREQSGAAARGRCGHAAPVFTWR
jgi:hypothetical protein